MRIETENICKEFDIVNGKVNALTIGNKLTGKIITVAEPNDFVVYYVKKSLFNTKIIPIEMRNCTLISAVDGIMTYEYANECGNWKFTYRNVVEGKVIKAYLDYTCDNKDVFIDSIEFFAYNIDFSLFNWSRKITNSTSTIDIYFTQLGQPVYYNSFFTGVEFTAADNRITDGRISLRYYVGRKLSELNDYVPHNAVIGSALGDSYEAHRTSFFEYIATFARPKRFRIQFNSWYDNMLDITHENIEESFVAIHDNFKAHGLRDIDCYVVDDGWVDYRKPEFWGFNSKFSDGFEKEKILTEKLGSTFGVWFGPRGGYTEAGRFAHELTKIGYRVNRSANEICCAQPKYVEDLCDKMGDFMKRYHVTYFKIDGFAKKPCHNKNHGHPVGGYKNLYFYSFQWEQWIKGFEKMRAINNDVFLNITSHSNCSPWALKYSDAVWINNASDMYYEGQGGNLDQCLNYRDGRYQDFSDVRMLQFPNAYIYNHEPCYATRNYNPPLPSAKHKTVVYSDSEFEQYLYMCMMRGTGFIELYYTPSMFNDAKWDINTKVLIWAENNFDVLSQSKFFGGVPKKGEVYGYVAYNNGKGYLAIRNPKTADDAYTVHLGEFTHNAKTVNCQDFYCNTDKARYKINGGDITFDLAPFEMVIVSFAY